MSTQASFALRGRNPDVLTCIANLSNDEVFTPPEFANRMLDTLAEALSQLTPARPVVWGDVIDAAPSENAKNAVRSALAMRAKLGELNNLWKSQDKQVFNIGIGINHGEVIVGDIGAPQRREFTVIGDTVNVLEEWENNTR